MAIVTLLAIETVMAIVTILAIKIDIVIVTVLAIETNMAIMTALAIETNTHFSRIAPGINARNSFQCNLQSIVFCIAVLPWLKTSCCVMIFLVTVETSNMTLVLASCTSNVGGIDNGGWDGVFPRSSSSLSLVIFSYPYVF